MRKCVCGYENDDGAIFCGNCGQKMSTGFCNNCKTQNAQQANFCAVCGASISQPVRIVNQSINSQIYTALPVQNQANTNPNAQNQVYYVQPMQNPIPVVQAQVMSSRRLTAGLLGLFLGVFGVHNFYLGNKRAIGQLLISIFSIIFLIISVSLLVAAPTYKYDMPPEAIAGLVFYIFGLIMMIAVSLWALVEWICIFAGAINVD